MTLTPFERVWLLMKEPIEEPDKKRCTCHAGKKCAWCLGLAR